MKRYFLIRHRVDEPAAPKEFGLLLILPGGPGSGGVSAFLRECNYEIRCSEGHGVSLSWSRRSGTNREALGLVWPSRVFRSASAKLPARNSWTQ